VAIPPTKPGTSEHLYPNVSNEGLSKKKTQKPGTKKRRSYRKPIGRFYRKSVVTTARPFREDFLQNPSWKSMASWWWPRDHAPAPRDRESSHTVAGITHHDNPPPDYYNTPDVGDTALSRDGTYSYSQHARGTCSHHSGVLRWDHYPGIIIPGRNPNPPTFFNYKFEPSLSPDIGSETGIEKYQIQTIDRIPGTPVCQKPMVWTERDGCQPKFRNRS